MGIIYEDVVLKNYREVGKFEDGLIPEDQVHVVTVSALVDTGAGTLVISEAIRQELGLRIKGLRQGTLADGASGVYQVTEPVDIHWQDRECSLRAVVAPGAESVLLGALPLLDMDLVIDTTGQKLIGAHGSDVVCLLK